MIVNKKVAVITGAASGIGLALAKACVLDGMNVVMADIAEPALWEQVKLLSESSQTDILGVVCDVAKWEHVERLATQTYEHFNRVDLLINNAGISGRLAPIWDLPNEHVRQVLDVNLHGVLHGVQVFLPLMFKQTHCSQIVNMASFYGLCSGSQMAAYAMSKHAIVALSESLYFDLRRLNKPVDVSVVCPSFANTQLLANSAPLWGDNLHNMVTDLLERSRPPEDIAEYILREVKKKTFYILPDKEVKDYCVQRTQAIVDQSTPHEHSLEKIIASLSKRASAV
jgi:NAD(P)-dependent dehydrogenase (short-subunit alcohol dehydrogenase family)